MTIRTSAAAWLLASGALLAAAAHAAEPLPVERLASVSFRGADLDKTRAFYSGVMGFEEVRQARDDSGQARDTIFKVNDDQFLAFAGRKAPDEPFRLVRLSFLAPEINRTRAWLTARQLEPSAIARDADGNLRCSLTDPDGTLVDFVAYQGGAWQADLRGVGLGPRRISDHLQHAGLAVASEAAAMALYRDRMGFRERNRGGPTPGETRWIVIDMPSARPDFIEFMVHQADPPERRQHICFQVPDIDRTHQALLAAGVQQKFNPFVTPSGLRLMNVRDPNGMRVEFWEVKPDQAGK
jgi:catechol 2,3-dioxygenase-like lactoylglutathione lyase family enzyme